MSAPPPERQRPAPTVFESLAATAEAAPATVSETLDQATVPGPAWMRTNLPPELLERYEPHRTLNVSAGQADLIVCRERAAGAEVVIKLYRYSDQLDRGVLARLYQADPQHVVRLLDHGESRGVPWEVQEYCPHGTLADLRQRAGGRLAPEQMPHVVRELTEALHHLHGLGITHRDLKPQNVLVRALEPEPDLVLTDFGVAREQFQMTQFTTIKATFAWAAPEVHEGVQKAPVDWWALGAVIFELLTGRHLLADQSGRILPDVQIRPIVMRGLYTTEQLGEGRWRDLVDGLLSHNPAQRWGHSQVSAWLAGRNPPVHRTAPVARSSAGTAATGLPGVLGLTALAGAGIKFVFNGHPVVNGSELAIAMRRDWQAAEEMLGGQIDPALEQWLNASAEGARAVEEMRLESSPGARLVRLQAALDPSHPVEFRGSVLDDATLSQAVGLAAGWQPDAPPQTEQAVIWLTAVRDQRVLRALAGLSGTEQALGDRLGRADLRLDEWRKQVALVLRMVPDAKLGELVRMREKALLGQFFAIALGVQPSEPLVASLRQSLAPRDTTGAFWLEGLAVAELKASASGPDGPGVTATAGSAGWAASAGPSGSIGSSPALGRLASVAVVTQAVTADNLMREREDTARREAAEATARAEMAQTEREMAAARRRHNAGLIVNQLRVRAIAAVAYAALGGWALADGGRLTGSVLSESLVILVFALVAAALMTGVDRLLENPSGPIRGALAAGGITVAMIGWIRAANSAHIDRADIWAPPLIFATAWILGDIACFGLRYLTVGQPITGLKHRALPDERPHDTARRVAAAFHRAAVARAWAWVAISAAVLTVLSGLFYPACGSSCASGHDFWFGEVFVHSILPVYLPPLSSHPWVLAALALVAWCSQLASRPLLRVRWALGWIAFWAGLSSAMLVLITGPDSPLGLLVHWVTGPIPWLP